jgi:hypothetical protein
VLPGLASCKSTQASQPRITTTGSQEVTVEEPQPEPKPPSETSDEQPQVETTAETEQADIDLDEVVVSLGDKQLTLQHILWVEPRIKPQAVDRHLLRIANWWIDTELLYAEAVKRGLEPGPSVRFLTDMMRKYEFQREFARNLREGPEVTEEEISDYYEQNKQTDRRLTKQSKLAFVHVRTKTREQAEQVLKRINDGEDIKVIAKQVSIHKDAAKSGNVAGTYDYVRKRYEKELVEPLLQAQENELVGPIEVAEDVYEVALLNRKTEPELLPFEEARDDIRSRLRRKKGRKAYDELLKSLRDAAADKLVKSPRLLQLEEPESSDADQK